MELESNIINQFQQLQMLITLDVETIAKNGMKIKKRAISIKVFLISVTFLITVILGIGFGGYGEKIALVLSALISAVTAWESYAQYQRKLLIYAQHQILIEQLLMEISFYLSGTVTLEQNRFDEYKSRFLLINDRFNSEQLGIISSAQIKSENTEQTF